MIQLSWSVANALRSLTSGLKIDV
uniref:Uncharacterized protein n=1 Tax=Arundo donax TaxID=35708 RepID=A0A0A8ZUN9_ARUDO